MVNQKKSWIRHITRSSKCAFSPRRRVYGERQCIVFFARSSIWMDIPTWVAVRNAVWLLHAFYPSSTVPCWNDALTVMISFTCRLVTIRAPQRESSIVFIRDRIVGRVSREREFGLWEARGLSLTYLNSSRKDSNDKEQAFSIHKEPVTFSTIEKKKRCGKYLGKGKSARRTKSAYHL